MSEEMPAPQEQGKVPPEMLSPAETGSEGTQVPPTPDSKTLIPIAISKSEGDSSVGAALGDLRDTRNSIPLTIAVAAFQDAQASRETLRQALERSSRDRDLMEERFHDADKTNAVLLAQLKAASRLRRFQRFAFALGGTLLGAGIGTAAQRGHANWGDWVLVGAGIAMMFIGSPFFESGD